MPTDWLLQSSTQFEMGEEQSTTVSDKMASTTIRRSDMRGQSKNLGPEI